MKAIATTVDEKPVLLEVVEVEQEGEGFREIGRTEDVKKSLVDAFHNALDIVRSVGKTAGEQLGRIAKEVGPNKAELELSMSLSAQTGLWVFTAKGEGTLKVKFTWEDK
jgi:hypothetical protein